VKVEHQIVGSILNRGDLLQHHLPFQLQVFVPEEGISNQVRKNLQCLG
jgi:hypothetical protein